MYINNLSTVASILESWSSEKKKIKEQVSLIFSISSIINPYYIKL